MPIDAIPGDRPKSRARDSHELDVRRFLQPDDVTCGPTCLRKVYHFYGRNVPVEIVLGEVERNEDGGTLAVNLGIAALGRDFRARIFSYNLRIFDPTWSRLGSEEIADRLELRRKHVSDGKARRAMAAYVRFLRAGGEMAFDELTPKLLKAIINRDHPILAGLSATYLYRMARECHVGETNELVEDDIAGEPIGHFVVISGYRDRGRRFTLRDPSAHVPHTADGRVVVEAQRLINAILLGDLTYDAVLLELWPSEGEERQR